MWHEETKQARESGDLVLLGVIQEQHPDRCGLFAQWKGIDWPILHDPINLVPARAVPIFVAIDEAGIVVDDNLKTSELESFLARPANKSRQQNPDVRLGTSYAGGWIDAGDHHLLWDGEHNVSKAIQHYQQAVRLAPDNGSAHFRLGVALRTRYDSRKRQPHDFQAAVEAWGKALDSDPNHYIYRRRIQQYGPRLIKPYPFYDWIAQAREEIKARGETPVRLMSEPVGAEIASPSRVVRQGTEIHQPPDPRGRIIQDQANLVDVSVTVVPAIIAPGDAVRVHLEFRPRRTTHWNNEAEPLTIWIDVSDDCTVEKPLLRSPQPQESESHEVRNIDFELKTSNTSRGTTLHGYALYYVCEDEGGQCLFLRKNIEIPIQIRK